ncbi:hypothetical protein C8R44DRAFT_782894 [Mycena epipterygia]|nr:hypothetical protein C8R44DRAFT_782894 [Mycena epipterygia]
MRFTDLGHDVLLEICGQVFEDNPRDRVVLSWGADCGLEDRRPRIFPGPPAQILLDLAPMHSELALATRPYIWREVLVAFRSYDKNETGCSRLERAQRPHIAPFVRAIFLSFYGNPENFLLPIVTAIPLFTSLRAVCLGSFQTYDQPRVPKDLAKIIREHPCIDTLSVRLMTQCADLIKKDSSKPYSLELHDCHENSTPLLLRPKAIRFLCFHNCEPQKLQKNCPADIWDTLEHFDPGAEDADEDNHRRLRASLKRFVNQGRRPALKSLDLSGIDPDGLSSWLKIVRGLDLEAFTYASDTVKSELDVLEQILDIFPKLKRLHIGLPSDEGSDEDQSEFEIDPDVVDILSQFPNLERLTLSVDPSYYVDMDSEDAAELGQSAVEMLCEECLFLRSVQLVFESEDMECEDNPVIVEYNIHRDERKVNAEVVAPRLLEGTIFEFLQQK